MGTADDIQEMQQLLASIRQAIEEHGATGRGDAMQDTETGRSQAEDLLGEAPVAAAEPDIASNTTQEDWLDDDLEWAEPSEVVEERVAEPQRHDAALAATARGQGALAANTRALQRPATMLAGTGTDGAATTNATVTAMAPAVASGSVSSGAPASSPRQPAAPRLSVLSGGRTDAAVLGNSRLSAPVQARVKAAMARMERIEAAKRALGGEAALRRLVADLVEPLIENWLEKHLPDIVERRVQAELDRILKRDG